MSTKVKKHPPRCEGGLGRKKMIPAKSKQSRAYQYNTRENKIYEGHEGCSAFNFGTQFLYVFPSTGPKIDVVDLYFARVEKSRIAAPQLNQFKG